MPSDNKWMFDLDKYIKEKGEPGTDDMFPTAVSGEEREFGFAEVVIPKPTTAYAFEPTHIRAIAAELGSGMRAIKMNGPGGVAYAIWNDKGRPAASEASSLQELRLRFKRR